MASLATKEKSNTVHVLHVDDDAYVLEISKEILTDTGNFDIDFAYCIEEAFRKMANVNYDVVISDFDMPQKNGLQFLEELREKNNEIPFILFTGKGREEVAIKALNLGADAYINKQGNPETVYGELSHAILKIVERKKAKESLKKNQERLRKAQAIAHVGNWELDLQSQTIWASEEAFKIYGLKRANDLLPLKSAQEIVLPEYRPILDSALQELITNNKEYSLEFKIKRPDNGQERFIHSQAEVLFDKNNNPTKVNGVIQDITERKKTEEVLKTSEAKYRSLADSLPEIVFEVNLQGKLTYINKKAFEITGYTQDDFDKGMHNFAFIAPEDLERAKQNFAKAMVTSEPTNHESLLIKKDGSTFPATIEGIPIKSVGKIVGMRGIIIDLTERNRIEDELWHLAERNYLYLEAGDLGACEYDFRKKVLFLDGRAKGIFGIENNSEPNFEDLFGKVHSKDKLFVEETINRAITGFQGGAFHSEFRVVSSENLRTWISSRGQVFFEGEASNLKPSRLIGVFMDITREKEAEEALEKASEDLRNDSDKLKVLNEKLKVIGSLTRHDVRNKLTTIRGTTYLIKRKVGNNPELLELLNNIDQSVISTNQLLDFSGTYEKMGSEKLKPVNAEELFNQAAQLFPDLSKIEVSNELEGLELIADSQLKQLFYNLIDNSLKHSPTVTRIRLYYVENSASISLFYEDNGVGVPEDNKPKLFTKGFTTGGHGFGLHLIQKLARTYGWNIEENGIPGKGARFEFKIPIK